MITKKEYEEIQNRLKSFVESNWMNKDNRIGAEVTANYVFGILKEYLLGGCNKNMFEMCQESVEHIQEIPSSDPFYEGHKRACRSAADVAYKLNTQAKSIGEITIAEKENGCEYENITQYTLEVKGGETYLNHNGKRYNVSKLIECYCKCAEENTEGRTETESEHKLECISKRVENLENMVEEINKTIKRIFEIIY